MVQTITRDEYNRKRTHGYAGTKEELLPETQEHWPGSHWILRLDPEGTCLVAVNLVPRNRKEKKQETKGRPLSGETNTPSHLRGTRHTDITLSNEVYAALSQVTKNKSGFIDSWLRQNPQIAEVIQDLQ